MSGELLDAWRARELVEHHGLAFHRLDPSQYEQFLEEDGATPALRRLLDIGRRRERARESLAVAAFARCMRDQRPDLILINGEMHEHIIAVSTAGTRVALLNSFVSIWRQPGVPPPHTLARPGVGWSGTRGGASMLWLALRLRKQYKRWSERVRRIGCDRVSVYRDLARAVGFARSAFSLAVTVALGLVEKVVHVLRPVRLNLRKTSRRWRLGRRLGERRRGRIGLRLAAGQCPQNQESQHARPKDQFLETNPGLAGACAQRLARFLHLYHWRGTVLSHSSTYERCNED